jgi:hypothetical protein
MKLDTLPNPQKIDLQSQCCQSLQLKLFHYLQSFPKHDQIDSPKELAISLCERIPLVKVEFFSLAESRCINEKEVPYRGWDIPQKTKTLANTKPWDFNPATPSINRLIETKRSIIKDSQEVVSCYECKAKGEVDCVKCTASGKITCERCEGSGRVGCKDCNGRGKQQRTRMEMREEKCGNCGLNAVVGLLAMFDDNPYTRARRCGTCGGRGTVRKKVQVPYDVNCKRCRASGKVSCGRCKTTGKITCDKCKGKTLVVCEKCEKQTRLVKYLELERNFAVHREVDAVLPPQMEELRKHSPSLDVLFCDYESSLLAETTETHLDLEELKICDKENGFISSQLRQKVNEAIETGRTEVNGERVVSEKLAVSKGEAFFFKYHHEKKSYIGFTTPTASTLDSSQSDTIAPHYSPVARWLRRQMQRAQEFSESGDQRTVGLLLKSCEEVSANDPYLQSLFVEKKNKTNLSIQYIDAPVKLPVPVILSGGFGVVVGTIGIVIAFLTELPFVAVGSVVFTGIFLGLAYWLKMSDLHLIED